MGVCQEDEGSEEGDAAAYSIVLDEAARLHAESE